MKGMQDNGVMACAKHFPGHGDTDVDSHYDLPIIPHTKARLDSIELFPFRIMAEQGVGSMMVAHLHVPLSMLRQICQPHFLPIAVNNLLRKENGL